MKIGILGGGLAGLMAGRELKSLGKDFRIFERENVVGGLCRTNRNGGYVWDFGVHAIYSRSKEAMDFFYGRPLDYRKSVRNVKIVHRIKDDRPLLIGYPFENGIISLPAGEKFECILGYLGARMMNRKVSNLQEWIDNRLGFGVAKHFMLPYNKKIWNCPLNKISTFLVSSKIEPEPAFRFIKGALWKKTTGREYQSVFIYPRRGICELPESIARDFKEDIAAGTKVQRLVKENGKWTVVTSAGAEKGFDTVVSTIPLAELLKMIELPGVKKSYDELRWNNTYFVMIGLKRGSRFDFIDDCHWVFFKRNEIFYRATLMHNFSDLFLPTLVAEITEKEGTVGMNKEDITQRVVGDILSMKILKSRDDIADIEMKRQEYTYAIPTVGLEELKSKIRTALEPHNLLLFGRNGNWDYLNMDGIYLKAKEFVAERFKI